MNMNTAHAAESIYSALYLLIDYMTSKFYETDIGLEDEEIENLARYYELAGKAKTIAILEESEEVEEDLN